MEEQEKLTSSPRKRRRTATQQPKSKPSEQESDTPTIPKVSEYAGAEAQPEPPIGKQWGEFPSPERQVELAQRLKAWEQENDHGERPGPFAGEGLNGAEVFWLATQSVISPHYGNVAANDPMLRYRYDELPPLSGLPVGLDMRTFWLSLNFSNLHLEGVSLYNVNLEGVQLTGAQLQGAYLSRTRLSGAILTKAQLQGADLYYGQLQDAVLANACLTGTILEDAMLAGLI